MHRHSILKTRETQKSIHHTYAITTFTYPVVNERLPRVLQFFPQSVALENVDDTDVEQEAFALRIPRWNSTGTKNKNACYYCERTAQNRETSKHNGQKPLQLHPNTPFANTLCVCVKFRNLKH